MNKVSQVTPIIEDQVEGLSIREDQGLIYTPNVLLVSLSLPGVHWNTGLGNSSSSVVLGREDVAWRPLNLWKKRKDLKNVPKPCHFTGINVCFWWVTNYLFYTFTTYLTLTSAPNSVKVSIRTAVWMVMCRHPAILAPFRGLLGPYRFLISIKPGISFSARMISLRPQSARLMSANKEKDTAYYHDASVVVESLQMCHGMSLLQNTANKLAKI